MKKFILFYSIILCINIATLNAQMPAKKKSKIAIVSLFDAGYKHIGKYSDWNKKAYALKHGYDIYLHHELLDHSRPPAWNKIPAIQAHLDDYEWIFWTDADSLIMNDEILLESIIDNSYDLIIAREATRKNLNTGSFLIKNSEWSKQLLRDIYKQEQFINAKGYWEQAALKHLLKMNSALHKNIKIIAQRVMNSHLSEIGGEFQPGDFVIHFYTPMDKAKYMADYYNLALNFQLQKLFNVSEIELNNIFKVINTLDPDTISFALKKFIATLQVRNGCIVGDTTGNISEELMLNPAIEKLWVINQAHQAQWTSNHLDVHQYILNQRLAIFENRLMLLPNTPQAFDTIDIHSLDFVFLNSTTSQTQLLDLLHNWFKALKTNSIIAGKSSDENLKIVKLFLQAHNSSISLNNFDNKIWFIIKP